MRQASQRLACDLSAILIQNTFLARDAVTGIRSLLRLDQPPETILVTGRPGCGKSSVVGQVIEWVLGTDWRVLSLDVSGLTHQRDTQAVGMHLDLPLPPARALALAATGGRGLLVIDALDSVSLNRDKAPELFLVVDRLIKGASRSSQPKPADLVPI